jgi:hypothetical protein
MFYQFVLQNAHFALNIFAALIFFAVAWLYLDAGISRNSVKEILKVAGFILLSISFVVHASVVESQVLSGGFSDYWQNIVFSVTRIFGYIILLVSLLMDPLQPKPKSDDADSISQAKNSGLGLGIVKTNPTFISTVLYPVLALAVGLVYLRRATTGLERHLKPMAYGFFVLALAELFSFASLLRNSTNISIYNLVAPFGIIWIVEHLTLFVSILIFRKWVFGYLLKRFETQLFMIFTSAIVILFLLITVSFTGLLVNNLVETNNRQLTTDSKVLDFAINSKKSQALSDAISVAQDPRIVTAVDKKQRVTVADLAGQLIMAKKQSLLIITDKNGQVIARGDDHDHFGDSLSNDALVKLALSGSDGSSILTKTGVVAPEISVVSVTPIKNDSGIIGSVLVGSILDSAFLDGIKKATGLDASLYGNTNLSATTLTTGDGVTKPIGIHLTDSHVINAVVLGGKRYTGATNFLGKAYFAAYMPLLDLNNNPAGTLMVGVPQTVILAAAGSSIKLTFIIIAIMLVLSIIPSYIISKYMSSQIH